MTNIERATKYEVQERVSTIIEDIITGNKTTAEIRQEYPEIYGVSEASINKYIEKAYDVLRKRAQQDFFTIFNVHLARYEYIYSKCWKHGFKKTARRALKNKENLLGLHQNVYNYFIHSEQNNIVVNEEGEQLAGYDIEKLNGMEKERLKLLLDKAKK